MLIRHQHQHASFNIETGVRGLSQDPKLSFDEGGLVLLNTPTSQGSRWVLLVARLTWPRRPHTESVAYFHVEHASFAAVPRASSVHLYVYIHTAHEHSQRTVIVQSAVQSAVNFIRKTPVSG